MPPRRASVSDRTRPDHRGRAVSVAVAASAGFASPIGYQTHLMVYGVVGYRFSDFVRIGVPLDLLVMALTVAIHPSLSRSDVEDLSFGPTHWLLPHGGSLVKLIAGRSRRRNL